MQSSQEDSSEKHIKRDPLVQASIGSRRWRQTHGKTRAARTYLGIGIGSPERIIGLAQVWMEYYNEEKVGYILAEPRVLGIGVVLPR